MTSTLLYDRLLLVQKKREKMRKENYQKIMIRSKDVNFYFWALIYDDLELLRSQALHFEKERGNDLSPYVDGLYSVFHTQSDQEENIGIIRFHKKYLTSEITSHEILHAALYQYRRERSGVFGIGSANFGRGGGKQEERLCTLFGELYESFVEPVLKIFKETHERTTTGKNRL